MWRKGNICALLAGMSFCTATMENSIDIWVYTPPSVSMYAEPMDTGVCSLDSSLNEL